jgi:hypothetical protein
MLGAIRVDGNLLVNNSAKAGYDYFSDTPTTNWCTLNPIFKENTGVAGGTFANGNLEHSESGSNFRHTVSTQALPSSGKVYVEVESDTLASSYGSIFGLMLESKLNSPDSADNFGIYCQSNGTLTIEGTNQGTVSAGDIFSLSVDMSASPIEIVIRKNNSVVGSNPYTLSTTETLFFWSRNIYGSKLIWNFGQRAFAYTPPTGFKPLNTANLPAPTVKDGSQYFNTVTYTGNGSNGHAITGVGFQPDLVWGKCRSVGTDHYWVDAVRGVTKVLRSNVTNAEYTQTDSLVSFDSDGFTLDDDNSGGPSGNFNISGRTYAAWNWVEGANVGFDIVSYTGNGVNGRAIAHSLGVTPAFVIVKNRDSSESWAVWHKDLGSAIKYLVLNNTAAVASASAIFGGGANEQLPDSTNFYIGSNGMVNANNADYIAYCFAEVESYSKFGSYAANDSTDGPFVHLGFTPKFLIIKSTTPRSWLMLDAERSPYNPANVGFKANETDAERTNNWDIDFLSNGFKVRGVNANTNTDTSGVYTYAAFASNPFGGDGVSPATAR